MSFERFTCRDTLPYPKICLGTVKSTKLPCKNKPKDINGFCHQHHSQSVIYAKQNPWSVISSRDERGVEILTKVKGIVPNAFTTSQTF